jgi:hypothetical protein
VSYQQLIGVGMKWPYLRDIDVNYSGTPAFGTGLVIDAATEKAAYCGRVWFPSRSSTKAIRKIHFRCGAVTLNALSSFRVSLQDMSSTAIIHPDATPDENWTTNTLTANGWNTTGNLSADRTVAFGEQVAVVFDYATFTAADSVIISGVQNVPSSANANALTSVAVLFTGSWAAAMVFPNVVLEFSDGTFGTLYGTLPVLTVTTVTWSNSAADDARGLEFSLPIPCKIDGLWVYMSASGASADFAVEVWDGTSVMANGTVTIDADQTLATGSAKAMFVPFAAELTLAANTTYRATVRPTTANNISLLAYDLNDAAHRVCYGGTATSYNTKTDGGAWGAATTTRIPLIQVNISSLDDGAGGSGGLLSPNLHGNRMA